MRINASLAAALVGVTDKTLREWCATGRVPGAEKIKRLHRPDSWDMDMGTVFAWAWGEGLVSPERMRVLSAWLDLYHETVSPSPALVAPREYSEVPVPTGSYPPSASYPAGTYTGSSFRTAVEGARWLMRHGINSEGTPKSWPGWPPDLEAEAMLALAIVVQRSGRRKPWRLHHCDDEGCICRSMLA